MALNYKQYTIIILLILTVTSTTFFYYYSNTLDYKVEYTYEESKEFYNSGYELNMRTDNYYFIQKLIELDPIFIQSLNLVSPYPSEYYLNDPSYKLINRNLNLDDFTLYRKDNVSIYNDSSKYDNSYYKTDNKTILSSPHLYRDSRYKIPETREDYFEIGSPWTDVVYKAFLCKETGYDEEDFKRLLSVGEGKGNYPDTHALLGLLILEEFECYFEEKIREEKDNLIENIVNALERDNQVDDEYIERVLMLYWSNRDHLVKDKWIKKIIDSRNEDDLGWGEKIEGKSCPHSTGMAMLTLKYYLLEDSDKENSLFVRSGGKRIFTS